jgi:hypothetical protein
MVLETDSFHLRQYIVTDLLKALLGNGSVNTFQRATMEIVSQLLGSSQRAKELPG